MWNLKIYRIFVPNLFPFWFSYISLIQLSLSNHELIILDNVIDTFLFYRISIQCLWKNEESHITCLLEWSDDYEQVGIHFERNPILWFLAFFASVFTEERYVAILTYSNNSHQLSCTLFKAILILVVLLKQFLRRVLLNECSISVCFSP